MPRSTSAASCTPTGVNSTLNDGAAVWIAMAAFERRPTGLGACDELTERGRHPKPVTTTDIANCYIYA